MKYFIDTSVLIDMLRATVEASAFVDRHERDTFITSTICAFEVASGVERSHPHTLQKKRDASQKLFESFSDVLPFTAEDALEAGKIYAALRNKGEQIEDMDILIAATALHANAVIVTLNRRHFERIEGLSVAGLEA